MHILILASFYPSPLRPTTGTFIQDQVTALHRAGHRVGVIILPRLRETLYDWRRKPLLPALTREDDASTAVYRSHRWWFPRVFPGACQFITRHWGQPAYDTYVKEQGQPDLIHAHNTFYAGYLAALLHKRDQIPVVLTEHSSNFLRGRIFLPGQHKAVRHTLAHIDTVATVGTPLAEALRQYAPGKTIHLTNNMINTDFFVPAPTKPALEPFHFAAVGYLRPIKRFDLLIQAFTQAFGRQNNVTLTIGGEGPQRGELENLIKSLGMGAQISLPGQRSREQVRDLLQNSHVLVSSSHVETFGITLIEAMACGKPVIATRSGGPERFIRAETGMLVARDDPAALAQAMQTMRQSYTTFVPETIRQYCVDHFSESAVVHQLEQFYALATEEN